MAEAKAALIEMTGVDGSHWTISGQGAGAEGVELGTAPTGIYDAPVQTMWHSSFFQAGATPAGYHIDKRDIVFGVNVFATKGLPWEMVDSGWRKAWAYDRDSTMTITTDFGSRSLALRLSEQPTFRPVKDPHLKYWGQVTMTCTAGVPWWVEQDVTPTWQSTVDTTGVDPATGAQRSQTGFVSVENPTDQPMWLRWVCSAPGRWTLPDFSWTVGEYAARKVRLPLTTVGQDLTVDTDPMEEMIVSADGSQIWALMNGVSFMFPVPPYTPATELPVTVESAPVGASVMCVQPRNWSRPWGLL